MLNVAREMVFTEWQNYPAYVAMCVDPHATAFSIVDLKS